MWSDPSTWSVIVTGGSSGLGAAICRRLVKAGASVVSLDIRDSDDAPTICVDIADTAATADATNWAIEQLGGVDAGVCCAGIDSPGPFTDIDAARWERVVAVNLLGTAAVLRAAWPSLLERNGRAVTVASTLGHRAVGDATAYCASKFGVIGLSRALAAEYKGRVGVTLLTPGGMRTSFFDGRDEQYRPGADASLADADDVAASVLWAIGRPDDFEVRELAVMSSAETSWP